MIKILYILPALAVLGLFSVAYAETDQQRIDKFEDKIDRLEERIDRFEDRIDRLDPATDQQRIDKFEDKIDRLEERIDRFEDKIAELEAQDAGGDAAQAGQGASYTSSTYVPPADTEPEPQTARASVEPEVDATVTITADGRLVENAGTVEIPYGSSMTLDVRFVNEQDTTHKMLVDLISSVFETQRNDIKELGPRESVTLTFAIPSDAPHDDDDAAKLRLVFSDSDNALRGDHAIKVIRTGEPPEIDETTPSGPPSLVSITLDPDNASMEITFSAPIDISKTNVHRLIMMENPRESLRLSGATLDRTADDSETLTLMLTPEQVTAFNDGMTWLNIAEASIFDLDGNLVGDNQTYPIKSIG